MQSIHRLATGILINFIFVLKKLQNIIRILIALRFSDWIMLLSWLKIPIHYYYCNFVYWLYFYCVYKLASNNIVSKVYSKFNFVNKINKNKSLAIIKNFQSVFLILYLFNMLIVLIFNCVGLYFKTRLG
jgi:hypothetical protein